MQPKNKQAYTPIAAFEKEKNNDSEILIAKKVNETENGDKCCACCVPFLHFVQRNETPVFFVIGIVLAIVFWFTFQSCISCVFVTFVFSWTYCSRHSWLQLLCWPSFVILIIHMHILREFDIKTDFKLGKLADNLLTSAVAPPPPSRQSTVQDNQKNVQKLEEKKTPSQVAFDDIDFIQK